MAQHQPDREAFLRRIEEQRKQNQIANNNLSKPATDTKALDDVKIGIVDSKQNRDGRDGNDDSNSKICTDKHILQYLQKECGLFSVALDDFDFSSLEKLRVLIPQIEEIKEAKTDSLIISDAASVSTASAKETDGSLFVGVPHLYEKEDSTNKKDPETSQKINSTILNDKKNEDSSDDVPSHVRKSSAKYNRSISALTEPGKSERTLYRHKKYNKKEEETNDVEDKDSKDDDEIEINTTAAVTAIEDTLTKVSINYELRDLNKQLFEMVRTQKEMLRLTRKKVDMLEKRVEDLQFLLLHAPTHYNRNVHTRFTTTMHRSPSNRPNFWEKIKKTRTVRALQHAYNEARRQNIHANLDAHLFFKMIFFVVVIGGRSKGHSGNSDKQSFMDKYRFELFALLATFIYFLQIGFIGFLYRFITKDLQRLEAQDLEEDERMRRLVEELEEEGDVRDNEQDALMEEVDQNDDGAELNAIRRRRRIQYERDRERNGRFDQILEEELDRHEQNRGVLPQRPAQDHIVNEREQNRAADRNRDQPGLTDGGIDNTGGFFNDVKYLFGSFLLSLIPTWKPVKVDNDADDDAPADQVGHGEEAVDRVD